MPTAGKQGFWRLFCLDVPTKQKSSTLQFFFVATANHSVTCPENWQYTHQISMTDLSSVSNWILQARRAGCSLPNPSDDNNIAVDLIERGDFGGALMHLQACLSDLRSEEGSFQCRKRHKHTSVGDSKIIISQREPDNRNIHPLPPESLQGITNWQAKGGGLTRDTASNEGRSTSTRVDVLIQKSGIGFPHGRTANDIEPSTYFSSNPSEDFKIRSSIVIFNLGLVFHLRGESVSCQDPYHTQQRYLFLGKAMKLYHQSARLLLDTIRCYDGCSTGNILVDVLHMSLLNNLAQVSMQFLGRQQDASRLFRRLRLIASSLSSFISMEQGCNSISGGDDALRTAESPQLAQEGVAVVNRLVDFFLMNTASFHLLCLFAAPAA